MVKRIYYDVVIITAVIVSLLDCSGSTFRTPQTGLPANNITYFNRYFQSPYKLTIACLSLLSKSCAKILITSQTPKTTVDPHISKFQPKPETKGTNGKEIRIYSSFPQK